MTFLLYIGKNKDFLRKFSKLENVQMIYAQNYQDAITICIRLKVRENIIVLHEQGCRHRPGLEGHALRRTGCWGLLRLRPGAGQGLPALRRRYPPGHGCLNSANGIYCPSVPRLKSFLPFC